jgi:hypothetical protein
MRRVLVLFVLGCLSAALLSAGPIVTWGQGSAVTSIDRSATFDGVVSGTGLSAYVEDGLSITIPTYAYTDFTPGIGFSGGFHYPSGGDYFPTLIQTTGGDPIFALEMHLGTGYSSQLETTAHFAWDTWTNGVQTGGGYFSRDLASAQIFGLSDPAGFTLLRIVNYASLSDVQAGIGSSLNALALDNLRVQLAPGEGGGEIPEPGTLLLAGAGLVLLLAARRRKSA